MAMALLGDIGCPLSFVGEFGWHHSGLAPAKVTNCN